MGKFAKVALSLGVLSLAACGGGKDPGVVNTAGAGEAVADTTELRAAIAAGDGLAAASAVFDLGSGATALVAPEDQAGGAQFGLMQSPTAPRQTTGTCDCTATGCTFAACSDEQGSFTMDGSISVSGDTVTVDLTVTMDFQGFDFSWTYDGAITVTENSIDGALSFSGDGNFDADGQSLSLDFDIDIAYDAIQLDGDGCAVGGSVTVGVDYRANSGGQSGSYAVEGTASFGPSCGDVSAG